MRNLPGVESTERVKSMNGLSKHVGKPVVVHCIRKLTWRDEGEVKVVHGTLLKVDPKSNIEVRELETDPDIIQKVGSMMARLGKQPNLVFVSKTGLPFLGLGPGIIAIHGYDGRVLYHNKHALELLAAARSPAEAKERTRQLRERSFGKD